MTKKIADSKRAKYKNCKYAEWMCDAVIEVAEEGGYHAAMMLRIGVSKATFYNYRDDFPEFKEALERADLINLARQEKLLLDGAEGNIRNYNFTANAYILQNKYKSLYQRDNKEQNNTAITINNLNLSPEQRDYKIAQISEKLRSMGINILPDLKVIEGEEDNDS